MPLKQLPTDISALLNEMEVIFKSVADSKKLRMNIFCAPSLPPVMTDVMHLRRILTNLVGNALKFTYDGGVDILADYQRIDANNVKLVINVIDTGIGISENFMKNIFKPFQQDDATQITRGNRVYEGTGLGLAISAALIKQMGGEISVESKIGEGSRFTLTFPKLQTAKNADIKILDKVEPKSEPVEAPVNTSKKKQVLIVDDVPMNLRVLEAVLKHTGVVTTSETDPAEALEAIREKEFDIVFTDLWMPEINGMVLARKIRKFYKDRKILIYAVTADTQVESVFDVSLFDGVLNKPISFDKVKEIVNNF